MYLCCGVCSWQTSVAQWWCTLRWLFAPWRFLVGALWSASPSPSHTLSWTDIKKHLTPTIFLLVAQWCFLYSQCTWEGDMHKCMTGKVCKDFSAHGEVAAHFSLLNANESAPINEHKSHFRFFWIIMLTVQMLLLVSCDMCSFSNLPVDLRKNMASIKLRGRWLSRGLHTLFLPTVLHSFPLHYSALHLSSLVNHIQNLHHQSRNVYFIVTVCLLVCFSVFCLKQDFPPDN